MTALKTKQKVSHISRKVETEAERLRKLQAAAADVAKRHREGKIDAEQAIEELTALQQPNGGFFSRIFGT